MAQQQTRSFFKLLNKLMILEWRLGLGPWMNQYPTTFGRYMVLTTTGHRSGLPRRTPVNYTRIDDGHVGCVAGFGAQAHWYRNLQADPRVELWLPDGRWQGVAETVANVEAVWLPLMRQVLKDSGFAAPIFSGIDPHTIADEELRAATEDWPLVRIRLERPLSDSGGPGDLVWVWPLVGLAALVWFWRRRKG